MPATAPSIVAAAPPSQTASARVISTSRFRFFGKLDPTLINAASLVAFPLAYATCGEVQARVSTEPTAGASGHHASNDFSRYVKGLCALCNNGNFDQISAMLFRAYSKSADDCVITRDEVATILANHVVYTNSDVR